MAELTTYMIDRNDRLVDTGGAWRSIAEDNRAESLVESVYGRLIWDFISNGLVKKLYKELFPGVRVTGTTAWISFRFDSPKIARHMELKIEPLPDLSLKITSKLLVKQEFGLPLNREVTYRNAQPGRPMCSKCNKVFFKEENCWFQLCEAFNKDIINEPLKVIFGMCDSCTKDLQETIWSLMGNRKKILQSQLKSDFLLAFQNKKRAGGIAKVSCPYSQKGWCHAYEYLYRGKIKYV